MRICTSKQPHGDLASNRLYDVPRILIQYPMGYTSLTLHLSRIMCIYEIYTSHSDKAKDDQHCCQGEKQEVAREQPQKKGTR